MLGRTVAELGQTMSAAEFMDHFDDWARGEWGERRADARAASICQTVASFAGKSLKNNTHVKLSDFLLKFETEEDEQLEDSASFFREFGNG
jgi:hypothetical protein